MSANDDGAKRNEATVTTAEGLPSREDTVSDIVRSLNRVPHRKLGGVQRLVNSPMSRVFTPRSLHGLSLFSRLMAIDAVFSRCEQEVMRRASSMASFDEKMALERRMFELNTALVGFVAEMAVDFKVEDVVHDPAIADAIKGVKQARQPVKQPPKSGKARQPGKDRPPEQADEPPAEPLASATEPAAAVS